MKHRLHTIPIPNPLTAPNPSQREYVYNKPITVRGSDGVETMRTMKLKTPHQETHCVW